MRTSLLFLPGTLCDARLWQPQIEALSASSALPAPWRCVVADYRYADSIGAMAALALAQALEHHDDKVIPIGLSMGAMVALEIWRQAPERVAAMALFDTDPGADTPARCAKRDAQLLAATHGQFRSVIKTQLKPAYFSPSNTDQALRQHVIKMALDQGIGAFAAQLTALATRQDSWELLKTITVPTLVACGADDQICLPAWHERMASLIADSTYKPIENAGHLTSLEQPAATTECLQSWLKEIAKH